MYYVRISIVKMVTIEYLQKKAIQMVRKEK